MYLLLILFFGSLVGISFMIGRKFMVMQEGVVVHSSENLIRDSYEEWKHATIKNIKKYSYVTLVGTIRFYVHAVNFTKRQYETLEVKVKNIIQKKKKNNVVSTEPSKFLKMISDYKHKIRKIRHQINEEENL